MSLNATPAAERVHIGFFGLRNAGKSSLVNAVTGQEMALVSSVKGTTTDPVFKTMELLPLGPVVIIDTPGFDDEGELGRERVRRTRQTLSRTDVAVLVVDGTQGLQDCDRQLMEIFAEQKIAHLIAWNKCDLPGVLPAPEGAVAVSAAAGTGLQELKERIGALNASDEAPKMLVADLLQPGDTVVLVVPIDKAAPKGRLILPQQQVIRDALEAGAMPLVCRDTELPQALASLQKPPAMVICDSQVFHTAAANTPQDVPLTSFSILMARYKGLLDDAVEGVTAIDRLCDGDTILIAEGCTHHRQCEDIGTVKIPNWLKKHTGADIRFETASGQGYPEDLSRYALILHCGGCMLTERTMGARIRQARRQGVPVTNYGTAIAAMQGILRRSLSIFPDLQEKLEK